MSVRQHLYDVFDSELCVVGAASEKALCREIKRVKDFLERAPDVPLGDVAAMCARSYGKSAASLSVIARSTGELRDKLSLSLVKIGSDVPRIRDKSGVYYFRERLCPKGKIAFLFPGTVSFYPDILRDLCVLFGVCREAFEEFVEALDAAGVKRPHPPSDYLFPPTSVQRCAEAPFSKTNFAESFFAVLAANTALYRFFGKLGVRADGLAGFSGGELSALDVAGAYGSLSRQQRVLFMREGYKMLHHLMRRADLPKCEFVSLLDASDKFVESLLAAWPGRIALVNRISPRQVSLGMSPDVLRPVLKTISENNVKALKIPSVRPFNTQWCSRILPTVKQFLAPWIRRSPRVPVYSCATGSPLPQEPKLVTRETVEQWSLPIRFEETIRKMYRDGFRVFIEIGARGNTVSSISETLSGLPHQAVAANRVHRSGLTQLHHALGILSAQGVPLDLTALHSGRRTHAIDFDQSVAASASIENRDMLLSPGLPSLKLFEPTCEFAAAPEAPPEEERKAMPILHEHRKVEFGADFPMLSSANVLEEEPGVMLRLAKTLSLDDYPFLGDYALGGSQLSYSLPSMRGLTVLSLVAELELMAEAARRLIPRRRVARVENLRSQRWLGFNRNVLSVNIRAERIAWKDNAFAAVRVQLRGDEPNNAYTWPVVECTILLAAGNPSPHPVVPPPLPNAKPVNWSKHDIYPNRLFHGESYQTIRRVDLWSEMGVDFEVEVPSREKAVRTTRVPLFSSWPLLLDSVVSAFPLWRSHEKFAGAISLPFRCRRIVFHAGTFPEGAVLRGYLRLAAVTPRSHVADVSVMDGAGMLLLELRGLEEICEHVPPEYQKFILTPSERFITTPLPMELLGNPDVPVAGALAVEVPGKIFEPYQELWLKTLAHVVLSPTEREEWLEMQGSTGRRLEWLFGRIVAKEATRRFLAKYQQAHWTDADIPIWADDSGKPHPLGAWREHASVKLDLSIAHTKDLILAAVASNAFIGIDVELIGRNLTEDFTKGVFTPSEMELAAGTGEGPSMLLRFWCAKEAISKALGTGIRYSPKDLLITSADVVSGRLLLELRGQWLDAFKTFTGRTNVVYTSIYRGHALASCVLPRSLFDTPRR